MKLPLPQTYELIRTEDLPDLQATGYYLIHKKTGARFALVDGPDENRVFLCAFRTPALGSTGVSHIIEHAVLNGSDRFPDKEAFQAIHEGSLATIATAGTAQDKTMYFYDTQNLQDYRNLLDYYLDTMFAPWSAGMTIPSARRVGIMRSHRTRTAVSI